MELSSPKIKKFRRKVFVLKSRTNKTKETALKKFLDPAFKNSEKKVSKKPQNFLYFFKNVLSHFGMTVDQAVK